MQTSVFVSLGFYSIVNCVKCNPKYPLILLNPLNLLIPLQKETTTMSELNFPSPYLCGGTFFFQIIASRKKNSNQATKEQDKGAQLLESDILTKLISIVLMYPFKQNSSLVTNTTEYKKCRSPLIEYFQLDNETMRNEFDKLIKKSDPEVLNHMKEFVSECILESKQTQLIKRLLGLIKLDSEIPETQEFFMYSTTPITKSDLVKLETINIELFLLSVLHYITIHRFDKNLGGKETIKEWEDKNAQIKLTNAITQEIRLTEYSLNNISESDCHKSFDDNTEKEVEKKSEEERANTDTTSDDGESQKEEHTTQINNNCIVLNQNGENNFKIDHINVLNL